MAGYDASKAATFNKLRQQGLSIDAATTQAGISDTETSYYAVNNVPGSPTRGTMGPLNEGSTQKVAGVDYDQPTVADLKESTRWENSNITAVDYDVEANTTPSTISWDKTPPNVSVADTPARPYSPPVAVNYTTTSTSTVSGGGTTTITAGPRVANSTSTAIQPAINAKQAELNQYIKDNPSDFARKKQGLPPLSPEENEQRLDKLNQLNSESNALKRKQIDAETATPATITTTPNTTTTENTVETGTTSVNQEVDPSEDENLSQQNETQLDATTSLATDGSYKQAAPIGADGQPMQEVPFDTVSVSTPGTGDGSYNQAAPIGADGQPMRLVPADDVAVAGAGRGAINPPFVTPDVETPAPVENPPYDENAGLEEAIRARAAEPVDEPLTAAQTEAALDEAVADATPSAEDVDAANDKSLQDIEDIRAEAETAPGGVTFPSANNDPTSALKAQVKSQGTLQSRYKQPGNGDWRVRLSLAPNSDYLYNAAGAGILAPLTATNGVIFPYTPTISVNYTAEYAKDNLTHSNYRSLFYKSSSVGDVQIRGTFTAQDTREAAYLLAVIHFFRSATKMFYGQDAERGTPPPLVYLSGYGDQQFSNHSCVVSSFNYSLPNEVDYIRTNGPNNFGLNLSNRQTPAPSTGGINFSGAIRLANALLTKGATPGGTPAQNALRSAVNNTNECTYVPTKMEIDITLIPVQTRSQVSKQFSLKEFANGNLLKKGFW